MANKSTRKSNTGSRKSNGGYKPSTAKQMNDAHNKHHNRRKGK